MALDSRNLESLARLSQAPEGRILLEYIGSLIDETMEGLTRCDAPEVYRQQGRAKALTELRNTIRDARADLDRVQGGRRFMRTPDDFPG